MTHRSHGGPLSAARVLLVLSALLAAAFFVAPAGASAGTVLADNGFRAQPDGFSFANYGNEGQAGLNASELERLYGPGVCIGGNGGNCVLTPIARAVMKSYNEASADGHCFGFATLSELIYKGYLGRFGYSKVADLGAGALNPFELNIEKNRLLQRSITRAFDFQNLASIQENTIVATPTQILHDLLHGALDPNSPQIWTFEIFQYGMKAGHAITPYAVEKVGPGEFEVLVYDNNWPGNEDRRLQINTNTDTWSYYAMVSPGYPQASTKATRSRRRCAWRRSPRASASSPARSASAARAAARSTTRSASTAAPTNTRASSSSTTRAARPAWSAASC